MEVCLEHLFYFYLLDGSRIYQFESVCFSIQYKAQQHSPHMVKIIYAKSYYIQQQNCLVMLLVQTSILLWLYL